MLLDITEVEVVGRFGLRLSFEDGTDGDVDVAKLIDFRGVFSPLADESEFARVRVNPELGTVTWPCGADLDPDVLYAEVKGESIDAGAGRRAG